MVLRRQNKWCALSSVKIRLVNYKHSHGWEIWEAFSDIVDWTIPNNSAIEARKQIRMKPFPSLRGLGRKTNTVHWTTPAVLPLQLIFFPVLSGFLSNKSLHIYARIPFFSQWMPAIWVMAPALDPPMPAYLGIIGYYSSPIAHVLGKHSSMSHDIGNN